MFAEFYVGIVGKRLESEVKTPATDTPTSDLALKFAAWEFSIVLGEVRKEYKKYKVAATVAEQVASWEGTVKILTELRPRGSEKIAYAINSA